MRTAIVIGLLAVALMTCAPTAIAESPHENDALHTAFGTCIIVSPGSLPPVFVDLAACLGRFAS